MTRVRRCRGFSLTEVLVASALLAVGLLGQLAALTAALRAEQDATHLATAATLAADISERIRTNPAAATDYAVDPAAPPAPAAHCALATPFDTATRAACDLDEWQREVAATLPGAGLEIVTVHTAASALCTITIRWATQGADVGIYTLQVQV